MAHSDKILKKRTGQEIERLFLQVCAGMRQSAQVYKSEIKNNPIEAENHIIRATFLPYRVEARINDLISKKGKEYVEDCIEKAGAVLSLSELFTELKKMQSYSDALKKEKSDDIADAILEQVENEALIYVVPIPDNYVDIWG